MAGLIQSLDPELGPRVHRLWASWFLGETRFSPESVSQADVFSLLRTLLLSGSPSPPSLLFPPGALKSGRSCSRRAQLCRVAEMLVGRLRVTLLAGAAAPQSCRGAAAGARVGGRSHARTPGSFPRSKLAACFPAVGQQMADSSQKCEDGPAGSRSTAPENYC